MQGSSKTAKKRGWVRRLLKWTALGFLVFFALIVVGLIGARLYYTDARLTALVRSQLKQHVPLDVSLGLVELRLTKGIVISDLCVGPPTPAYKENVLCVKEVRVGYRLAPLLDKQIAVSEVALDTPVIALEQQNGKWNVLAITDKFAGEPSSQPASAPASAPASEPSEPQPIGVEIDLEQATIDELSAKVISPDIQAALDHVSLRASGRYTGVFGSAKAELHIGDDSHGPSIVHAGIKGTGEVDTKLRLDLAAEARSLTEVHAVLSIALTEMKGAMAGFALPPEPVTLATEVTANLSSQAAALHSLDLKAGKALHAVLKGGAGDFLGDVDVLVQQADLDVDIDETLKLLPKGMVPLAAAGEISLREVALRAKLSELTKLTPFDAHLLLRLDHVVAAGEGFNVAGVAANVTATTLKEKKSAAIDLSLQANEVDAGGAKVNGATIALKARGPASVLTGRLDEALVCNLVLRAPDVTLASPKLNVSQAAIDLDATLLDFAANGADAKLAVAIANARYEDESIGVVSAPIALDLSASRRAPQINVQALALKIADAITLTLSGTAAQRAKAWDVNLALALKDVDIPKLLPLAPSKLRDQISGYAPEGSVGLDVAVKGPIPASIGDHFALPVLELLDAGTPFDAQIGLRWKGVSARYGDLNVRNTTGQVGVTTKPQRSSLAIEIGLQKFTMAGDTPITLDDAGFNVDASYEKGEAFGAGNLRLGRAEAATQLTLPLEGTSLDFEINYAKGGEIAVNRIALTAPTLGASLMLRGRVLRPERIVATKALESPTLKGIQGDLSLSLDVDLPKGTKLLPDNPLMLGGGAGIDVDAGILDGYVKVAGKLKTNKLNVQNEGMTITNMTGVLTFAQDVKKSFGKLSEGWLPVLSSEDILKQKARIAYYPDLRSYGHDDDLLRIERFVAGRTDISRIALNGRLERGMLLVDHFALQALTGDLEGQLALQLAAEKAIRLSAGAKFSNVDLSVLAKTPPGPASQINGNLALNMQWGEKIQEIDATTINLTRVGKEMLKAVLLALDPEQKKPSTKSNVSMIERFGVNVALLKVSVIHNLLNMDLDATIPFLDFWARIVGQRMLNTDPARRMDVKLYLDQYLAPVMNGVFAKIPGWKKPEKESDE